MTTDNERIANAQSLVELLSILNEINESDSRMISLGDHKQLRGSEIDWSDLPTFGGCEPSDTGGVWSWDDDSLLIGDGGDLDIEPRDD